MTINTSSTLYVSAGAPQADQSYQILQIKNKKISKIVDDPENNYWGLRVSADKSEFLCFVSPYKGPEASGRNDFSDCSLWVYSIGGSNGRQLLDLPSHGWDQMSSANWSPDGSLIILSASSPDVEDDLPQLYIIGSDGTGLRRISTRNAMFTDPSFAPGGLSIAYCSYPGNSGREALTSLEVYTADFHAEDTSISGETRHTFDTSTQFYDQDPEYAPDGNSLNFTHPYNQESYHQIKLLDLGNDAVSTIFGLPGGDGANGYWIDNSTLYYEGRDKNGSVLYINQIGNNGKNISTVIRDENNLLNVADPQIIE